MCYHAQGLCLCDAVNKGWTPLDPLAIGCHRLGAVRLDELRTKRDAAPERVGQQKLGDAAANL